MSEFIFSKEDKEILQRAIEHVEYAHGNSVNKFQFYQNAFNKKLVNILLKMENKDKNEK